MSDFLVEIGTEELPPKALRGLRDAFVDGLRRELDASRLAHGDLFGLASPRRLAVIVKDLAGGQDDREVVQKGPPVSVAFNDSGEPQPAALAFAKKCGVPVEALERQSTDKGEWLFHTSSEKGLTLGELAAGMVERALEGLPIPRPMRWGSGDAEFVRPVHWVVMLHGREPIPGNVLGVPAGQSSRGHRFHSSGDIVIGEPDAYADTLASEGRVIVDFDARRNMIRASVEQAAAVLKGTAIGNDELFDEVAALVEWPVAVTGSFDKTFLELPREVVVATLTGHQRYFPVADDSGSLLPNFITVANIESTDPEQVRRGNERVILPRLADAAFFWEADSRVSLGDRLPTLEKVVYQKGLGSVADKSRRVAVLAGRIAGAIGADVDAATRAAEIGKCDLVTGMVGEFPELQGTMGRYYAGRSGESEPVAIAIEEQYQPRFSGDRLPASLEGQAASLAERLDTLAGAFALGKKPSGNRDPFGLRRAALGVVRICIEGELDLDLADLANLASELQPVEKVVGGDVVEFLIDRLRGYAMDRFKVTAEIFDAVRERSPASLLDFAARLLAVREFVSHESAEALAAANKRIANILRQAEFDGSGEVDPGLLEDAAESKLSVAIDDARLVVSPLIDDREYASALARLAELRPSVDAFFDDVMVMADDEAVRRNRLQLLSGLRDLFLRVADVSRLAIK